MPSSKNESADCSLRNKQAKKIKVQRELFVSSNPAYGYYCEEGALLIRNDNTPEIIQRISKKLLEWALSCIPLPNALYAGKLVQSRAETISVTSSKRGLNEEDYREYCSRLNYSKVNI